MNLLIDRCRTWVAGKFQAVTSPAAAAVGLSLAAGLVAVPVRRRSGFYRACRPQRWRSCHRCPSRRGRKRPRTSPATGLPTCVSER